jgi:hypothetical protein
VTMTLEMFSLWLMKTLKKYSEEEGEVDLREELIKAIDDLRREKKKNKSLQGELLMLKENSQNSNSEKDQADDCEPKNQN